MKKYVWLIIPVFVAAMVLVLMKTVFFIGYVPTASMEPTLKEGDFIFGVRIFDDLKTGDIIVFTKDGQLLVKRIAATEGQQVKSKGEFITVPKDCFYMMGDNEFYSYDSRYWEEPFIIKKDVIAKVLL